MITVHGMSKRLCFAWLPVRISRCCQGWVLPTKRIAWMRRVVRCEAVFMSWYELPNAWTVADGKGGQNGN